MEEDEPNKKKLQPTPSSSEEDEVKAVHEGRSNNVREKKQRKRKKKEKAEEEDREDEAKATQEKGSDSYGRVTVPLYIKWMKGILILSPKVLGVPTKIFGAQSNTQTILQNLLGRVQQELALWKGSYP